MRQQPAPAIATWLLTLFCSDPENQSVIGDLLEHYQRGSGRFWYWRQVLAIVSLELYDRVVRRPLVRTNRSPVARGLAVAVVIAAVSAAALTDIWPILLIGVLGGVIAGILKFGHDNLFDSDRHRSPRDSRRASPQTETEPLRIPNKEESALAFQKGEIADPVIRAGEEKQTPMRLHRGINSTSIAGEGFEGLPGLLMMIAFVFIFLGLFWPRNNDAWFGGLFFIVEIGAAAIYLLAGRRDRKNSEQVQKVLHQINGKRNLTRRLQP